MNFSVSYEIFTQQSLEHGDAAERGFILDSATLRDAIKALFETRTRHVGGIENISADEYPVRSPRCISVSNGMEFLTGEYENRVIHFPRALTPSTRRRIYRLIAA